jgi:hypothetical protein
MEKATLNGVNFFSKWLNIGMEKICHFKIYPKRQLYLFQTIIPLKNKCTAEKYGSKISKIVFLHFFIEVDLINKIIS